MKIYNNIFKRYIHPHALFIVTNYCMHMNNVYDIISYLYLRVKLTYAYYMYVLRITISILL